MAHQSKEGVCELKQIWIHFSNKNLNKRLFLWKICNGFFKNSTDSDILCILEIVTNIILTSQRDTAIISLLIPYKSIKWCVFVGSYGAKLYLCWYINEFLSVNHRNCAIVVFLNKKLMIRMGRTPRFDVYSCPKMNTR